jgi:hypothetical protein
MLQNTVANKRSYALKSYADYKALLRINCRVVIKD